jgi:RNA polymerase sigma-70 factor (ECF subfamily)
MSDEFCVPDEHALGTPERLEDIFRRCSADLHRYIRRHLQRAADAPDLTQEIFERFIRDDSQARARNPYAYLFGIASHMVADARMTQQRDPITYDTDMSNRAREVSDSNEHLCDTERLALQDELTRALQRLREVHRVALLLTKREGLSSKEAALKMGTTEGSVRVYVCEARAKLKNLLKQQAE